MSQLLPSYQGVVYPWHCDHVGHMNVMWYVGKFDEATWSLFASLGLTPKYLRSEKRGMVAVDMHVHYRRELLAGDVVRIASGVLKVGKSSMDFVHEMRNDETDEIAAVMHVTGVHLDGQTRKSCALPAHVTERAKQSLIRYPADGPS